MASPELSRRVEKVVAYPPLCEMSEPQRREFQKVLLDANAFEDLPGKWQAAIVKAEENRPSCGSFVNEAATALSTGLRILAPFGVAVQAGGFARDQGRRALGTPGP